MEMERTFFEEVMEVFASIIATIASQAITEYKKWNAEFKAYCIEALKTKKEVENA